MNESSYVHNGQLLNKELEHASVQDVHEALVSLDIQKSPGMDRLSPIILKNSVGVLCEPPHHLFTQSLLHYFASLLENS